MKNCSEQIHSSVQEYYGQTLTCSESLLTNACTVGKSKLSAEQKHVRNMLNSQILQKYYGCGSSVTQCLQGKTIVDLGCGTGVDVYIASYFVKQQGKVIGIDMTPSQLQIAQKYREQISKKFNFKKSNVQFIQAQIQKIPLEDNSVDIVVSNCVISLSPNKKAVFAEVRRILKHGGQFYFSDVYADSRIKQELKSDKTLWGQGLAGGLYIEDFRRIMCQIGFKDCRVISKTPITVLNCELKKKVQGMKFYSITYRCFKLLDQQDRPEDYGQTLKYLGGIQQSQQYFKLDSQHRFKKGQVTSVCGNTASMIKNSRFGKHFQVDQRKQHRGLFNSDKKVNECPTQCCEAPCKTGQTCC